MIRHLTWIVSFVLVANVAAAEEESEDVNYLDLAAVMIRDKHFGRAEAILSQVDQSDEELDRGRFHTLRGMVRFRLGRYPGAVADYRAAIEHGVENPVIHVYLGQALFYSKDYEGSLAAFDAGGAKSEEIAAAFAMRAESLWRLKRPGDAWDMLDRGMKMHPDFDELPRRKVFYAIKLGLYRVGSELGRAFLKRVAGSADDYLAIGRALHESGSSREALVFLELARLRFPTDKTVAAELSRTYRSAGLPWTAGVVLERPALARHPELLVDAAELFREAGELYRALALNARIPDSKARLRQRLAVLLDLKRYEMVASMERDLRRVALLEDESILYAVAYSHFKSGAYERSERLLGKLRDAELFRKAAVLRKHMEDCANERWRC